MGLFRSASAIMVATVGLAGRRGAQRVVKVKHGGSICQKLGSLMIQYVIHVLVVFSVPSVGFNPRPELCDSSFH